MSWSARICVAGTALWLCSTALAYSGCRDRTLPPPRPSSSCTSDADCSANGSSDPCYGPWWCDQGSCVRDFFKDETDCQCEWPGDCEILGYQQRDCNDVICDADHQCSEEITAAGPAPLSAQVGGDCQILLCDGLSQDGIVEPDPEDLPDDHSECTVDECGDSGPVNTPLAHGDVCTDGQGICYSGDCYAGCVPADPTVCGNEGPSEPQNNTGSGASLYSQATTACGLLDGTDIDWYETYLVDADFEYDILEMGVLSTAGDLEICAFVLCNSGFPDGGCASKYQGPNGSWGCCWEGAPDTLAPSWDVDCSGTDDDGGTLYFSIRAPGGDDCDTYVVWAHY